MPQTPLNDVHARLGASFTDFGGWQMPVRYSSDLAEHEAVRTAAGLFDISHMAEIFVSGENAAAFLDYALVGQASLIKISRAKYSLIVRTDGHVIDDLIVYRLNDDEFLIIANAGNRHAVFDSLSERAATFGFAGLSDRSDEFALLAIQGPNATAILQSLTATDLGALPYYSIAAGVIAGKEIYFCRTGYTGEDGFELLFEAAQAERIFELLLEKGKPQGLLPAGLACRDTLRLEAGMPLYGHELDLETNPFEAGLGRVVKLDREADFVGKAALAELANAPQKKQLVGLVGEGRRAARAEYQLFANESSTEPIGTITSGALAPTLGYPVAMAYVNPDFAQIGTTVSCDIRGNRLDMTVVKLPFYKREN